MATRSTALNRRGSSLFGTKELEGAGIPLGTQEILARILDFRNLNPVSPKPEIVVPFWGSYLGSYKVFPKRNYYFWSLWAVVARPVWPGLKKQKPGGNGDLLPSDHSAVHGHFPSLGVPAVTGDA